MPRQQREYPFNDVSNAMDGGVSPKYTGDCIPIMDAALIHADVEQNANPN